MGKTLPLELFTKDWREVLFISFLVFKEFELLELFPCHLHYEFLVGGVGINCDWLGFLHNAKHMERSIGKEIVDVGLAIKDFVRSSFSEEHYGGHDNRRRMIDDTQFELAEFFICILDKERRYLFCERTSEFLLK